MVNWVEIRKSGDFVEMSKEYGITPVMARVLRNKDLVSREEIQMYLFPEKYELHDPFLLSGMDRVIFMLFKKINTGRKIRIIGDYDVDGICSTFILYKGLKFFGADVDYVIPHRIEDGYGINIKLIQNAYDAGVNTIITCDNGISALEQTSFANGLGMTMLITDHHEPFFEEKDGVKEYKLPDAFAVVDPKIPKDKYPFKGICGAMVAFKVILAMAKEIDASDLEDFKVLESELTEFAALATVCDVMELRDENRTLVKKGMKLMEKSKNSGLRNLIKVQGIEGKVLSSYHLGFVIGPCLNATGRLDTSKRAMELFLEKDEELSFAFAEELKALNEERKSMTLTETQKALEIAESLNEKQSVLVIYLPDCHESLAGIIAGRVREAYSKPAFVITKTKEGLKGSGRSIDAYDMFTHLVEVKDLLTKFGGHTQAAGISLCEDNLSAFSDMINEKSGLTEKDFCETLRIDMALPMDYANLKVAKELERLEPFGTGNEKPLFATFGVKIVSGIRMGQTKKVGKYKFVASNGKAYEAVYFGDADKFEEFYQKYDNIDICFSLNVNSFKGIESPQIQIVDYR